MPVDAALVQIHPKSERQRYTPRSFLYLDRRSIFCFFTLRRHHFPKVFFSMLVFTFSM